LEIFKLISIKGVIGLGGLLLLLIKFWEVRLFSNMTWAGGHIGFIRIFSRRTMQFHLFQIEGGSILKALYYIITVHI